MGRSNTDVDMAEYLFRVSESATGTPWIYMEPRSSRKLLGLEGGSIGFNLRAGTALEEAERVAEFLNRNVGSVFYSK
jgi:hypothetical protein